MLESICSLKEVFRAVLVLEEDFKNRFDLSINEAIVACALSKHKKCPNDLMQEIGLSGSRISRILSSLEKKKLVRRNFDKNDKRKMIFTLTTEGEKTIDILHQSTIEIPEILKNITK